VSAVRSMRAAVAETLGELSGERSDLLVMGADGQLIFAPFMARAPERHFDVGIAEATLVGVAAGAAHTGRTVVISAIAPFLLRRAYEQIAIDIAQANASVKMIGVGGGVSYGALGRTHHVPEDVALMRLLPNVEIFVPADAPGAAAALRAAVATPGPAYIRIGSGEDRVLSDAAVDATCQPRRLRAGQDLAIVASGVCVHEALEAARQLSTLGLEAQVIEAPRLRPWPGEALTALIGERPVVTVEEHLRQGGLGELVQEMLAERTTTRPLVRLSLSHAAALDGSREELLAFHEVDAAAIVRAARALTAAAPSCGHSRNN
jgi:transketolase